MNKFSKISIKTDGTSKDLNILIDGKKPDNIYIQDIELSITLEGIELEMEYFDKDNLKEIKQSLDLDKIKKINYFTSNNIYFELNGKNWNILINRDINNAIIKYNDLKINAVQSLKITMKPSKFLIDINMNFFALPKEAIEHVT